MGVLCSAIVLSGVFAPVTLTVIGGVVSTLIGAFFINRGRKAAPEPEQPSNVIPFPTKRADDKEVDQ